MSLQNETEKNMQQAIEHLKVELKKIRTGQANPSMVEDIFVEVYGTNMRLKELASITTPEARQILITPYDAHNSSPIGKAIEKANLGFNPIVDGNAVRTKIPQMDQSVRGEMVKLCHKKREEAKISIRNVRRDSNEVAKKQKNNGDLGEDELKKIEKHIQDLTDKFCKVADELSHKKEIEVSTI